MYLLLIEGSVKPGKKHDFINAWKKEILPNLKKQNGFVDEILNFSTTDQERAVGLCFWKTQEEGERYHREVLPRITNNLQELITGPPTVRSFTVEASETFRIAAGKAA
jgi:heme-degrading monooxygenase HmoA